MSQRIEALPCLDGLTPRQVQVLNTITDFQNRFCYSPTIGELADRLDISRTTAFEHIEQLRKKGLISPPAGKARSLTPSSKARKLLSRLTHQQTSDTEEVSGGIPLVGRVAAGLALAGGLGLKTVARGLASLDAIPGRLENVKPPVVSGPVLSSVEVVEPDSPFTVLVDFAHTDDALKNVLSTLKPLCKSRLIVLFGCGGDRDKTKRPRMAKVVEQFADLAIVTSDNPRTEDPDAIINEVVAGFADPKSPKIKVQADRHKAVEFAIESAAKNDVILLAGKGHENYQIIGHQKFPFSDKQIALACLRNRNV